MHSHYISVAGGEACDKAFIGITLAQLIIHYTFPATKLVVTSVLFAHTMVSSHRIRHDAGFTHPYACVPVYIA